MKMRDAYIVTVKYLQNHLPLDSQLLRKDACLRPTVRCKEWATDATGVLDIVNEREISF